MKKLQLLSLLFVSSLFAASGSDARAAEGYFLRIEGRALPIKSATFNGSKLLSSSIISTSLPIDISGYTKTGLNELTVNYISDPKSPLALIVEKRTDGPKKEEVAKLNLDANASLGKTDEKKLIFNLPASIKITTISELTADDKDAISKELQNYHQALEGKKAEVIRQLYKPALTREKKLCPENARFFENVVNREIQTISNENIKLNPLSVDGLTFTVQGNKVKLEKLTKDEKQPLILSNEVEVSLEPVMIDQASKTKSANRKAMEKLVRHNLYFQNIDNKWCIALPPNS